MLLKLDARVIGAALCIATAGCAGIRGFPDRTYSTADEMAALSKYNLTSVLTAYDSPLDADRGGMTREAWRNHVLEARIQDMNLHFADFEQSLYEQGIGFGVGTDWILLALTGAGSVASEGTANVLAAAATGVTGAKSAYSKDVLYDHGGLGNRPKHFKGVGVAGNAAISFFGRFTRNFRWTVGEGVNSGGVAFVFSGRRH